MAYFAQAGSGQAYTPSGIQDEDAADHQQSRAPLRVQAATLTMGQVGQTGTRSNAPVQAVSVQTPSTQGRSQFPAEGPDLHAKYQPQYLGDVIAPDGQSQSAPEPVSVTPTFMAAESGFEQVKVGKPQTEQALHEAGQSRLQDFVSQDYAVPGLGAQTYASQEASRGDIGASHQSDQTYPEQSYGGAAQQSYGYEAAEQEDYGYDDTSFQAPVGRAGMAKMASLLGAAASLALVIGIGVWGYQLVMRDVSGVPVVRAVEGPMRAQPENPGGRQADHQGLAVNSVAANGTAEAPADRLTLAPQPIELSDDDQPMSRLRAPEADTPPKIVNSDATQALPRLSEASVTAYHNGDVDALVAELTEGVAPLTGSDSAVAATPTAAPAPAIVQPLPLLPVDIAAVGAAPKPNSVLRNAPGLKVSLRPNLRPARFSPAPKPVPGTGRATQEVDPNSLPAGTRLAQLGAYESAAVARAEWDRIYSRFDDYLDGKTRVIQRAESGGRTFYRLRAMGFEGLSDARRFCSALVAGNADCIPVTTR